MRRKNVPVAARRTRACRWRRNPAWFGRTFFRVRVRADLSSLLWHNALKCVGLFWTGAKSSLFFPRKWLREERNFHTRENENDDSLLLPVANGVRRSELLIYARKCFLVTIFTAFVLSARYLYVYSSQRMVFAACSRVDFLFFCGYQGGVQGFAAANRI